MRVDALIYFFRRNIMKKAVSISLVVLLAFVVVVNVSAKGGTQAGGGEIKIGVSFDAIDSQFFVVNEAVIKKDLEEAGVKVIEVIAEGDAQKQNQQIDTLISQGVKAIIVAPKDGTAIVSAIKRCNAAGIPVVTNNRAATEGAIVSCSVASNNKIMASRELEYIAKKAQAAGKKYVMLEFIGDLKDVNAVYRHEGVTEIVNKYPDVFTKVIPVSTEWKAELADSLGQAALQANPDINMIFTASDLMVPAVKSMLQKFGRWYPVGDPKHVTWATFDGAADAVNEIKVGYIDIVSVQDATLQAHLCTKNALALARGEKVEPLVYDPGFEVTVENVKEIGFDGY
jgi:ABC-type sugar transport system substrate-binding protein